MLESKVEKHFKKRMKEAGGTSRKMRYIGRRHCPDRIGLLPDFHFWAELKRPGKDASAGQAREHYVLAQSGIKVYVLDTIEKIDKFLIDREFI